MHTPVPAASGTSRPSNSAEESSASSTAAVLSAQARTVVWVSNGALDPTTRIADASASSNSQPSKVPRERSLTARPLPLVRAVRQRSSSGSAPWESTMPGPLVSVTLTSSSDGRGRHW